ITGVTAGLYVDESGDTMTGALTINATNGLRIDSASNEVAIGRSAQAQTDGTAIGALADGGGSGAAVGMQANASGSGAAVGFSALASDGGAALGRQAEGQRYGAAAGYIAKGSYYGAALGNAADGTNYGAALGYQASGSGTGVAVGASANGAYLGVAVGYGAMGYSDSVAVGANANGTTDGAAVGYDARGYNSGAAVGYQSDGYGSGAALGYQASGMSSGVAVGAEANSGVYGVGVGYRAQAILGGVAVGARSYADYHGVAVGRYASGADTNVAIGYHANSRNGQERISIGHNVTNDMDDTARLRGHLYMDGGMSLWGRTPFGSGIWQQLVPLPDLMNVVWVATNGTPGGPGTIDRPYDAPQAGYNAAAARYTNEPAALVIAAGRFPGLNMTAGNIHVLGFSRPQLQSLTVSSASANILGKQRVENIIFDGVAVVAVDMGSDVKFHNCRFQKGLQILGSRVEVQDCYATGSDGPAVTVGNGTSPISEIAIYNSSMFNKDSANPALLVNNHVYYFEVIACEIVNFDPTPGVMPAWAAIEDQASALHPNEPPHLYSHNIIRGAEHGGAIPPAVYDPFATNLQPTITFVQNTVWGDVGMLSNRQFFANNTVYGQINNVGGPIGWSQAGIGSGNDPAGNTEHQGIYPQWGAVPPGRGFPAAWQD
ncbi:MAG: hypothetical protein JXB04_13360, partial [Kiritimatiellae bacterium]|nr:hypothetical protein [Kiritimatiellia bacterium]